MAPVRRIASLLTVFSCAAFAAAHEIRPAYLELTETAPGRVKVVWKKPISGEVALELRPQFPEAWRALEADRVTHTPDAIVTQSIYDSGGPLAGQTVRIDGLSASPTDALLRVHLAGGTRGFDYEAKDAQNRMPASVGYSKGVPMGGDLRTAPAGKSPTFLVAALKDPIGANLDRYQIVKGWMDSGGELYERVYDVAWSGNRKPGKDGKLPQVGNTVDVPNATYANSIGSTELSAVWKDPDFDPKVSAFYYGRVLEIPTPRWTAYDAKYFGITMPPEVPMTTIERAYTSPIWYTPGK
jgi:Protein of unknown function (DUF3604)